MPSSSAEPETTHCLLCGAPLSADVREGLCAACLPKKGMGSPAADPGGLPTIEQTQAAASAPNSAGGMRSLSNYELLEEIGQGGMGVVYLAEQKEPVRRRVALKIIKLGMDTRQVVARFEAERQALALMDHPNIARVLDAGATETGRPYFVMELVRGIKITDYCDQHKLSTRERLDLFVPVCRAIQHAHQKGIIHRDVKPSNILVMEQDGKPVPKVIDFGIAKATGQTLTDKTVFTAVSQIIGTPAYMSPEQAEGGLDIDTRTDIYSLGVLLYELLTGKTPFDTEELIKVGLEAMRKRIREEEPPRPSTRLTSLTSEELTTVAQHRHVESPKLINLVRGDLDWIVMKALDKERARRYDTANGLAMDIKRHLENQAVLARPPSAGYKFRKFALRNKVAMVAAATIVAVLAIATCISGWQAIRATRAEAAAKQRLAESEALSKFLREVFQSPNPARDGRTITVAETLDRATRNLERDLGAQPARRAQMQTTLADTYFALGLDREAIPLQEKVRDFQLATSGPESPDTLRAMHALAVSYHRTGRWDEALKLQEQVLAASRQVLGSRHPNTLKSMQNLASSYQETGRRDQALKLREQALALCREACGSEHPDTLLAMNNLANSYFEINRREEALKLRDQVLTLRRKVLGPEHPDTLMSMQNLANSYSDAGRWNEALALRQEGFALSRKLLGPEHFDTLRAMNNLAISYAETGRRDEALKLREECVALSRKVLGPEHYDTMLAMQNLALSYRVAGRREEALKLREEVLSLCRKVLNPEHPDTLFAMFILANSYQEAGRRDEALALREQVVALRLKVNGLEHPNTVWAMIGLAGSYREGGRADEAVKMGLSSLEILRRISGPTHNNTLNAMTELAISYRVAGQISEAVGLEEEALQLKRRHCPAGDPMTLESIENLAACYELSNRKPEAEALKRELIELKSKTQKPASTQTPP